MLAVITVLQVHNPPENLKHLVCRICEKLFSDWTQFLYHMHRTHVAMELPYACEVCSYRSSCYSTIIEHITQVCLLWCVDSAPKLEFRPSFTRWTLENVYFNFL